MFEQAEDVFGFLVVAGIVVLVLKGVERYNAEEARKTADRDAAEARKRWEQRVRLAQIAARHYLNLSPERADRYYQDGMKDLGRGMWISAERDLKMAAAGGHWQAMLQLAAMYAVHGKTQEAAKLFDRAVLAVSPDGVEPADFRQKLVGMVHLNLEGSRTWTQHWDDRVGRAHPGLVGAARRAKAIEMVVDSIPPLKP